MNHQFCRIIVRFAFLILVCTLGPLSSGADDVAVNKESQARRRPPTYLAIFINGYGSDPLPQEPAEFERLLISITKDGHFNAILCQYSPQRETLCKKHNLLMVVDLLAYSTEALAPIRTRCFEMVPSASNSTRPEAQSCSLTEHELDMKWGCLLE